ncbi:hypothetical protein SAMN05443247_02926 [Bradyrhizobium erythrophlei]|jgi:hypothetical protein|nr:hypothetical protein SAMN05443247_02926 [Bradyrhizobium erythrophlei]
MILSGMADIDRAVPIKFEPRRMGHGPYSSFVMRKPAAQLRGRAAIHPGDAGNAIPRDGRGIVSIRRPQGI